MTELNDQELMDFAHKWLDTPELQRRPDHRSISFIASVALHWRQKQFITKNQRAYVEAILHKHTHR